MWGRDGNAKGTRTKHEKRSEVDLWLWLILHSHRGASVFYGPPLCGLSTLPAAHLYSELPPFAFTLPAAAHLRAVKDYIHSERPNFSHRQAASGLSFKQLTHFSPSSHVHVYFFSSKSTISLFPCVRGAILKLNTPLGATFCLIKDFWVLRFML